VRDTVGALATWRAMQEQTPIEQTH
jgi:hypothetical protein